MEDYTEEGGGGQKKITQLLLNTSEACFLCLQDNYGGDDDPPEDLNGGIINLSTICGYLNINQGSLLSMSTTLNYDGGEVSVEEFEQDPSSFLVNLCPKCVELTNNLNHMIIKLEEVNLMVNFHLSSFHKNLEEKKMKKDVYSNNSLEPKLVQLLRKEIQDKSLKILRKAAIPQIILSKCKVPPPPEKTSDLRLRPSPPTFEPPPPSTSPSTSRGPSVKHLIKRLASNAIPSNKPRRLQRRRCPFCPKIMGYSKMTVHLCCLHPSKLLSSYFPPSSSQPPSEDLCKQVLHLEVIAKAAKIQSDGTPTASPRLGCHLCGITYGQGSLLKQHFLTSHTNQLIDRIHNYGKNPQLLKRKPEVEEKYCLICRQTFSTADILRKHQASQHPDQLFLEMKPSWMGGDRFGGICKEIFRAEVKRSSYGKAGDKHFKCGYCEDGEGGKIFRRHAQYLVVHLAWKHRREMEGKLKDKLGEDEEERGNGLNFGGDDEGGDGMVVEEEEEEDESEIDVKPDIGELGDMLYPDTVLDELGYFEQGGGEGDHEEEDDMSN